MSNRLELHDILVSKLGSKNVYFQPPTNVVMKYPAIVYSLNNIQTKDADNINYLKKRRYSIILIHSNPDNEIFDSLLDLPYCTFDRHYKSDNLNHYSLTLYF